MQCPLTKLLCLSLLLLAGCSSQPAGPTTPIYIEAIALKEKLAGQQFANANYQQALEAYQAIYNQYLKIDSQTDMARLLTNRFQTALIIEDINSAKMAQAELQALLLAGPIGNYQQRFLLLSANLAIIEQQWPAALALLKDIPVNSQSDIALAARISEALVQLELGNYSQQKLNELSVALSAHPSLLARVQRLQASVYLRKDSNSKAAKLIRSAKQYYQSVQFPPGVAESLMLEAELAQNRDNTELSKQLRHRAKAIFILLGNKHAIKRHGLES